MRRGDGNHGFSAPATLTDDFGVFEEKLDFEGRVFRAVGAMHRIGFDVFGELLADGALIAEGRVRVEGERVLIDE